MGAKKNQKGESGEQKKADGGKKQGGGGGGGDNASVVLKADLHCEGCISKIVKTIRGCDGVEDVKVELGANKVTVTGKVDPAVLKEKVEAKTHKQVVVVSPQPGNKGGEKAKDGGGGEKQKKKEDKKGGDSKEESKGEDDKKKAKEKEPTVTTAVFKMNLHCEGCIQKIYKIVSKTKGYHDMKLDRQKELVTVTGAMDMKALAENLKKHLKRDVEIVPPKKEGGGGEKKEKGGGGGGNEKGNEKGKGGGKKEGGGGGGGGGDGEKNKEEAANKMQVQVGYPYQGPYPYMYGPGYVQDQMYYNYPHAPQMFSDENPNACSVM